MPNVGFQQVHGNEWFSEPDPYPFMWGKTDPVFFRGARQYIAELRATDKPWLLTLLTVGTHQPYAVPEDVVARYPNRMIATVAILDRAVADFLQGIRADGVLDDTLVLITSDESHGDDIGEWVSSWGLMAILAPEGPALPRIKAGGYGLVDIEASVLDYLGLPAPDTIIGRSMFRDYRQPREMVSFTNSKLRWQTSDGRRFECSRSGGCTVGTAPSLIGPPPQDFSRDDEQQRPAAVRPRRRPRPQARQPGEVAGPALRQRRDPPLAGKNRQRVDRQPRRGPVSRFPGRVEDPCIDPGQGPQGLGGGDPPQAVHASVSNMRSAASIIPPFPCSRPATRAGSNSTSTTPLPNRPSPSTSSARARTPRSGWRNST